MKVLVTGGAGFIGSNFLNLLVPACPEHEFVNLDVLSYAANLRSLEPVASASNYRFVKGDVADQGFVDALFAAESFDLVVHFAAESHVDRSILGPREFLRSNVEGTLNLLEACRAHFRETATGERRKVFHHVSTDEVYGSIAEGSTNEGSAYRPSNPYAASKAASDHFVRAWGNTYGIAVKVTTATNNFGPRQFPEKLVPLVIARALEGAALPIYGDGKQVRDWIFVDDHCRAIWEVALRGRIGETYNIGADQSIANLDLVRLLCRLLAEETGRTLASFEQLITFVPDRAGHDRRYASNASKLRDECGWSPAYTLEEGLRTTVRWYLQNQAWLDEVRSGAYKEWIVVNYGQRAH